MKIKKLKKRINALEHLLHGLTQKALQDTARIADLEEIVFDVAVETLSEEDEDLTRFPEFNMAGPRGVN